MVVRFDITVAICIEAAAGAAAATAGAAEVRRCVVVAEIAAFVWRDRKAWQDDKLAPGCAIRMWLQTLTLLSADPRTTAASSSSRVVVLPLLTPGTS